MRVLGLALLVAFASGCTSVKMVQREGCWIKRTEKIFGRVREEIGPCSRAQPQWVQDRLTRLVQECVAQADYRWQTRAMEAWAKGQPYPAQPPQQEILHTCMEEARVGLVTENETLKARLAEVAIDRDMLRVDAERTTAALRESHDKIAEWLGQAAQKPAPNAFATATSTSDGRATNENGATLAAESGASAPGPGAPVAPTLPAGGPPGDAGSDASRAPPAAPAAPGGAPAAEPAPPARPAAAPKRTRTARARRPAPVVQATPAAACEPARGVAPCEAGSAAPAQEASKP